MIEQLDSNEPPDRKPRLEVYPLSARMLAASMRRRRPEGPPEGYPPRLVTQLQTLVPNMQLVLDFRERKLLAFGTPEDHARLKETLEKLDTGPPTADVPKQVEVYRLTRVEPANVQSFLENLFPNAELTVDAASRSLIVSATPDDHLAIRNLIDQLQPTQPRADSPVLRVHPLREAPPTNLTTMLQALVPAAQITMAADSTRLLVVASPADQDLVQKTIEQLEQAAAPGVRNTLKFYPVTPAQRTRFQAILTDLTTDLPGIRVITEAEPGELAIWAKPQQHAVLTQLLEELKHEVTEEEQYRLFAHPLNRATAAKTLAVIQQLYPQLKIIQNAGGDRLLLWTNAAQFAEIQQTLQELEGQTPADQQQQFRSYAVRGITPAAAIEQLQTVVPEAKLSVDAATGKLIAWAMPADHDRLAKALEQLTGAITGAEQQQFRSYPVRGITPAAAIERLQTVVPEAKLSVDATTGKLIAWAMPADHDRLAKALEQLTGVITGAEQQQFRSYAVSGITPAAAIERLQTVVPEAKLSVDAATGKLIAWAMPADHERLAKALEELTGVITGAEQQQFRSYAVRGITPAAAIEQLQTLVPGAKLSVDATTGKLIAWAMPADHDRLAKALEELTGAITGSDQRQLEIFPLAKVEPTSTLSLLQSLLPDAKLSLDAANGKLIALASPKDLVAVRALLEQLREGGKDPNKPVLEFYPLTEPLDAGTQAALAKIAPSADHGAGRPPAGGRLAGRS